MPPSPSPPLERNRKHSFRGNANRGSLFVHSRANRSPSLASSQPAQAGCAVQRASLVARQGSPAGPHGLEVAACASTALDSAAAGCCCRCRCCPSRRGWCSVAMTMYELHLHLPCLVSWQTLGSREQCFGSWAWREWIAVCPRVAGCRSCLVLQGAVCCPG